MRLATYNLHFGGDGPPAHWHKILADLTPDIFFAQETRSPTSYVADLDPSIYLWRQVPDRHWGSAIYSAHGIESEIELTEFNGWVVGARCHTASVGIVNAFSIHNPTQKGASYITLAHRIFDEIAKLQLKQPIIIGADLNLRSAGQRLASESMSSTAPELALLRRLKDEFGLVTCWGCANPALPLPQTLRWARDRAVPYHCDVLLVPESWRVDNCEVSDGPDWQKLSDHNPVSAEVSGV